MGPSEPIMIRKTVDRLGCHPSIKVEVRNLATESNRETEILFQETVETGAQKIATEIRRMLIVPNTFANVLIFALF